MLIIKILKSIKKAINSILINFYPSVKYTGFDRFNIMKLRIKGYKGIDNTHCVNGYSIYTLYKNPIYHSCIKYLTLKIVHIRKETSEDYSRFLDITDSTIHSLFEERLQHYIITLSDGCNSTELNTRLIGKFKYNNFKFFAISPLISTLNFRTTYKNTYNNLEENIIGEYLPFIVTNYNIKFLSKLNERITNRSIKLNKINYNTDLEDKVNKLNLKYKILGLKDRFYILNNQISFEFSNNQDTANIPKQARYAWFSNNYNSGLEHIIVQGNTILGNSSRIDLTSLMSVEYLDDVDTIGEFGLSATKLYNVKFNKTIKHIMYSAFYDCKHLKHIDLPEGLKYIGDLAFSDCISLTEITIPSTVEVIGLNCLKNCENLEKIEILAPLRTIALAGLFKSYKLKKIIITPYTRVLKLDFDLDEFNTQVLSTSADDKIRVHKVVRIQNQYLYIIQHKKLNS